MEFDPKCTPNSAGTNRSTLESFKGASYLNIHIQQNEMSRIKIRPRISPTPDFPSRAPHSCPGGLLMGAPISRPLDY